MEVKGKEVEVKESGGKGSEVEGREVGMKRSEVGMK